MASTADQPSGRGEQGISIARARAVVAALERRVELLTEGELASSEQVGSLLTDASGWRLRLEAERLWNERRVHARDLAEDLVERHQLLGAELERLGELISRLRARMDELEAQRGL